MGIGAFIVFVISLLSWAVGVFFSAATLALTLSLRSKLKKFHTSENVTLPSTLKSIGYLDIILSVLATFAYAPVIFFTLGIFTSTHISENDQSFATFLLTVSIILCGIDIIHKVLCYYYSIKAIYTADTAVKTDASQDTTTVTSTTFDHRNNCQCQKVQEIQEPPAKL